MIADLCNYCCRLYPALGEMVMHAKICDAKIKTVKTEEEEEEEVIQVMFVSFELLPD